MPFLDAIVSVFNLAFAGVGALIASWLTSFFTSLFG